MPQISPKALVENPAGLAHDVRVGAFAVLGPEVTVGPGTIIDNSVTLTGRVAIAGHCRLFPGCVIGSADPAGAAPASVTIGEGNTIREHVVIEGGRTRAGTVLGPGNLLMVGCQIGPDVVLDGDDIFANFTRVEAHAHVERFVQTSGFATIGPWATVGAYTFTTGYTSIDRDAPPFAIVHGFPFRVRGVNTEKLRRCGFSGEQIARLKDAFRSLYDGDVAAPPPGRLEALDTADAHLLYLVASLRRTLAAPAGRQRQAEGAP